MIAIIIGILLSLFIIIIFILYRWGDILKQPLTSDTVPGGKTLQKIGTECSKTNDNTLNLLPYEWQPNECGPGLECVSGVRNVPICLASIGQECNSLADCVPEANFCLNGVCAIKQGGLNEPCELDSDCESGFYCYNSKECKIRSGPFEQINTSGYLENISCKTDTDCGDGGVCSSGECFSTFVCSVDEDCLNINAYDGGDSPHEAECQKGVCMNKIKPGGVCTKEGLECMYGYGCSGGYCQPLDINGNPLKISSIGSICKFDNSLPCLSPNSCLYSYILNQVKYQGNGEVDNISMIFGQCANPIIGLGGLCNLSDSGCLETYTCELDTILNQYTCQLTRNLMNCEGSGNCPSGYTCVNNYCLGNQNTPSSEPDGCVSGTVSGQSIFRISDEGGWEDVLFFLHSFNLPHITSDGESIYFWDGNKSDMINVYTSDENSFGISYTLGNNLTLIDLLLTPSSTKAFMFGEFSFSKTGDSNIYKYLFTVPIVFGEVYNYNIPDDYPFFVIEHNNFGWTEGDSIVDEKFKIGYYYSGDYANNYANVQHSLEYKDSLETSHYQHNGGVTFYYLMETMPEIGESYEYHYLNGGVPDTKTVVLTSTEDYITSAAARSHSNIPLPTPENTAYNVILTVQGAIPQSAKYTNGDSVYFFTDVNLNYPLRMVNSPSFELFHGSYNPQGTPTACPTTTDYKGMCVVKKGLPLDANFYTNEEMFYLYGFKDQVTFTYSSSFQTKVINMNVKNNVADFGDLDVSLSNSTTYTYNLNALSVDFYRIPSIIYPRFIASELDGSEKKFFSIKGDIIRQIPYYYPTSTNQFMSLIDDYVYVYGFICD